MNYAAHIVALTPEEHYVAHQLLVKIHPGVKGLIFAAIGFAKNAPNNRSYGWLRRRFAESLRGNKHTAGRKLSPEHIAKIVAGNLRRQYGPLSPGHRAKLSISHKGKEVSDSVRANLLATARRPKTKETRAKIADALRGNRNGAGCIFSPERRAKLAAASADRIVSPETRVKMSIARMGKSSSAQARLNQSLALRGKKKSPQHAAMSAARLQAYWRERRALEAQQ